MLSLSLAELHALSPPFLMQPLPLRQALMLQPLLLLLRPVLMPLLMLKAVLPVRAIIQMIWTNGRVRRGFRARV